MKVEKVSIMDEKFQKIITNSRQKNIQEFQMIEELISEIYSLINQSYIIYFIKNYNLNNYNSKLI